MVLKRQDDPDSLKGVDGCPEVERELANARHVLDLPGVLQVFIEMIMYIAPCVQQETMCQFFENLAIRLSVKIRRIYKI